MFIIIELHCQYAWNSQRVDQNNILSVCRDLIDMPPEKFSCCLTASSLLCLKTCRATRGFWLNAKNGGPLFLIYGMPMCRWNFSIFSWRCIHVASNWDLFGNLLLVIILKKYWHLRLHGPCISYWIINRAQAVKCWKDLLRYQADVDEGNRSVPVQYGRQVTLSYVVSAVFGVCPTAHLLRLSELNSEICFDLRTCSVVNETAVAFCCRVIGSTLVPDADDPGFQMYETTVRRSLGASLLQEANDATVTSSHSSIPKWVTSYDSKSW